MTAVFTTFFRQQLFSTPSLMDSAKVRVHFFSSYAAFSDSSDPRYTGLRTLADLQNVLGWSAPLPVTVTQTLSALTSGNSRYVIANNSFDNHASWVDAEVVAAAVVLETVSPIAGVTDPIIFITDSPFEGVMRKADEFGALPATTAAGQSPLFAWPLPPGGATQVFPAEGALTIFRAPPDYEYSHQQHAWLFPQRVNFIANPSFEGAVNHWRSNGTMTRVAGGAPGGGVWEARVTGTSPLVLESNAFPTKLPMVTDDQWTIQAMIRGTGKVRIGMLSWEADYASTYADWGPDTEVWTLPSNGWLHVYALRRIGEGVSAVVRIECEGTAFNVDNVLVEPEWLLDWPYFDGHSDYGAPDDFSWYGGENRQYSTYSMWYNHRRAVVGRLFAWGIAADDFTVTDEEVEAQGYVYKWVPAGVRVIPHMDVLKPGDPQSPIPAVTGSVLPYNTWSAPSGVKYPWPPSSVSLPGTTGKYVSTPDAAAFDITGDLCIIARVTPTNWLGIGSIVSKWSGVQCSYQLYLAGPSGGSGTLGLMWSTNGSIIVSQQSVNGFSVAATPWVAATLDVDNGNDGSDVKFWSSLDGVTWKQMGTPSSQSITSVFPSTTPINIGANTGGTANLFNGKIQDVRIYNGIGANTAPGQGTLVGHFDASIPWPGTTYTDETGKVWTLNGGLSFAQ